MVVVEISCGKQTLWELLKARSPQSEDRPPNSHSTMRSDLPGDTHAGKVVRACGHEAVGQSTPENGSFFQRSRPAWTKFG